MKNVVTSAKAVVDQQVAVASSGVPAAFLEAKVIHTDSREVLMFYKAYTVLDEPGTAPGTSTHTLDIGDFKLNKGTDLFVPYAAHQKGEKVVESDEYDYGDLGAEAVIDATLPEKDQELKRIAMACSALVTSIRSAQK